MHRTTRNDITLLLKSARHQIATGNKDAAADTLRDANLTFDREAERTGNVYPAGLMAWHARFDLQMGRTYEAREWLNKALEELA